LLLSFTVCFAEPPKVVIPQEIKAEPGDWVTVSPETTAKAVTYVGLDGLKPFPSSELKDPRKLILAVNKPGRYRFVAVGTLNDEMAQAPFVVVVGNPPPTPGPGPSPEPGPGPTPNPEPSPLPDKGYRVLIVYEKADLSKLPEAQKTILYGATAHELMNSLCVDDAGGRKAWRIWDKDSDVSGAPDVWKRAFARYKPISQPWILISNGTTGFEGPLPATLDEFKTLLNKYKQ
jgi:hypothetical protein